MPRRALRSRIDQTQRRRGARPGNAHSDRAPRFRGAELAAWRENGAALIERFFSEREIAPCRSHREALYGARRPEAGSARDAKQGGALGGFSRDPFRNFDDLPLDGSPALNLIAPHPALIDLVRAVLGVERVHLCQAYSWAKFTGEADIDQHFHCDFRNHTLTVPSEDAALRTIDVMIDFTDVTDVPGAIPYVPLSDSDARFDAERMPFATDAMQAPPTSRERSGAGPAGSISACGIDVSHRGTNRTVPGGHRCTLTASYKAAGNDQIGWAAWPRTFRKRRDLRFTHASPVQLACLGGPPPR